MHNSRLCIIQLTYNVFKGVSMSLRLKCVFIRQNISRKTECVLLLDAVYSHFMSDSAISLVFCRINPLL